jgi:glycosyltransferase involved in cell wall biosynthesis
MSKAKKKVEYHPFVSVCTPTYNRRPFIENMFRCFNNQNYPKNRMEWIIVDDGTDKIKDLIDKANIPQIRYFSVEKKMSLGAKRNLMHQYVKGSIIVYMDDDDYYPPERVSHAVERLQANKGAMCAGSSEIYIYFKSLKRMVQCGPYGPNHATAGTFAFRTELLKDTKYEDHAALAEERAFLKDYTVPFVQLDPLKTILVFSHEHNTFDKRKMLDNPHPDYLKDSAKTVDTFIYRSYEEPIKRFFMNEIDGLLANYEAGLPKMKPDVLEQMKKIEKDRAEMVKSIQQPNEPIILQQPGKDPVVLSQQDVVNIIQQQQAALQQQQQQFVQLQTTIQILTSENSELRNKPAMKEKEVEMKQLEELVIQLQTQLIEKTRNVKELTRTIETTKKECEKSITELRAECKIMLDKLQREWDDKTQKEWIIEKARYEAILAKEREENQAKILAAAAAASSTVIPAPAVPAVEVPRSKSDPEVTIVVDE